MNTPMLHLNLKRKWFDMIQSGIKDVEYREVKPYWTRIFGNEDGIKIKGKFYNPKDILICFSNGYSKDRDHFYCKLKGVVLGEGVYAWGGEKGILCYLLVLGEVLGEQ